VTTITQNITDIAGANDNTSWTFYTEPIRQYGTAVITTKKVRKYPVAGVLTVVLDPGPAVVIAPDGKKYPFTVPSADSDLWTLIAGAIGMPPGTTQQAIAAAVADYLNAHQVDEYHEYANLAAFPGTGVLDRLYLAQDTGKIYRWNGSAYIQIADKAAVGLGNVDNTSDANKPVSTAQQTALDGKQPVLTATAVKTSAYTAAVGDLIPADATSAAFTVTLPSAPADKSRVVVKKIDSSANAVAIAAGGSDVFNVTAGSTTLSLSLQYQAVQLQYKASGAIWYVISTDVPLSSLVLASNVATAATASTVAQRDSNANLKANAFLPGFASTATAAGTTTLTAASTEIQRFTGTLTQAVVLPTTGVFAGQRFTILNDSSVGLSVAASGGGGLSPPSPSWSVTYVARIDTPTLASHWSVTNLMPTGVWASATATAFLMAQRDGQGNLSADAFLPTPTYVTTAGGTTTLTVDDTEVQVFTGTLGQTVSLPTTSVKGARRFAFFNASAGTLTINASDGTLVVSLLTGTQTTVTALQDTPTTTTHWAPGTAAAGTAKTALSVNSVFQATYNLDTTALTASDVGAYTTAQTDAAVAAAVRVLSDNTAVGPSAQNALTTGTSNTALGSTAQAAVTTGIGNTAVGAGAQSAMTTGSNSTAFGVSAQHALTSGIGNTAVGNSAQTTLTTGATNTAVGGNCQFSLSTGANNTAVGYGAQRQPLGNTSFLTSTGNRQTVMGTETGQNTATQLDDITAIGYRATAGANSATALGSTARADHLNSVALGSATQTTQTNQVMVGTRDVEITDNTKGVILKSPDGTRYRITVANGGTLTVAVAP
jgi:hypothetical protein